MKKQDYQKCPVCGKFLKREVVHLHSPNSKLYWDLFIPGAPKGGTYFDPKGNIAKVP